MTLFKVKAGDKISAESFNRIIESTNPIVGTTDVPGTERRVRASWKNCGTTAVPAGCVVTCRLRDGSDPEKAKKRFIRDGFCLEGPVSTDKDVYTTATLLKTAAPNKISPCMIEGLVAGLVKCDSESEETPTTAGARELDSNGCNFEAGKSGFTILDCSESGTINGETYRFCLMRAAHKNKGTVYVANPYKTAIQPGVVEVADFYHRFDTVEGARQHYLEHGLVLLAHDNRKSDSEQEEAGEPNLNWPAQHVMTATVLEEIAPRDDVDDTDGPEGFHYGEAAADGFFACEFNESSQSNSSNNLYAVRSLDGLDFKADYFSGEFYVLNYVKDAQKSDTVKAVPKYYVKEQNLDNDSLTTFRSHRVPDDPTVSFEEKYGVKPADWGTDSYDKTVNYSDVMDLPEAWSASDESGYGMVSAQEKLCFGTVWKYSKPQSMIATGTIPGSPGIITVSVTEPNTLKEITCKALYPFKTTNTGRAYMLVAPLTSRRRGNNQELCGAVVTAVVDKNVRDSVFCAENRTTGSRPLDWDESVSNDLQQQIDDLDDRVSALEE